MVKNRKCKVSGVPSFLNSKIKFCSTNSCNGLYLKSTYFPEEVMILILSHIDPKQILKCGLVCHKWNNLIKSFSLWSIIYERTYKRKAKKLPWYLYYCLFSTNYFNINLLLNGNGQDGLNNWVFKIWDGDNYIEDFPISANPLPADTPDFNNNTSCFITSYFSGFKMQLIELNKNKLFQHILNNYKPHMYLSEWTTGRRDCSCVYKLQCGFVGENGQNMQVVKPFATYYKLEWIEAIWEKMELLVVDYPDDIKAITFENEGRNTQSWKGHYGSKMAGGVVKFLFDSIVPLQVDGEGNAIPNKFQNIQFFSNGLPQDAAVDYFQWDNIWNDNNEEIYYFMP